MAIRRADPEFRKSSLENSARQSYQRIFRSSSIMGMVSMVEMMAGLVRTKFAALFVGVQGVGLLANLTSIQGVVGSFASWGIPSSGMREIALAHSTGDQQNLAQTICAMMRWCWISALVGAALVLLLAPSLATWAMGDSTHVRDVLWLAVAVFCGRLAMGYTSVLQAMHQLRQMALATTINAMGSSAMAAFLYWKLGIEGVAFSMVASFVLQLLMAYWFYRRLNLPVVSQSWRQTRDLGWPMLKLGTAFMWNGLLLCLVGFGTNAFLTQHGGLAAVGIFNAAMSLSTVMVSFLLSAMSVDYAPRLAGVSKDKPAMNHLMNQQLELGLLISTPLIGLAMVLSVPLIHALYSSEFVAAADVLRWLLLGNLLRVIALPLAFIVPTLGLARLYFVVETSFNLGYLLSMPSMLKLVGVVGVAYAYLIMYALYTCVSWALARRHAGFHFHTSTLALLFRAGAAPLLLLAVGVLMPLAWGLVVGGLIWLLVCAYCLRELVRRVGTENRVVKMLLAVPVLNTMLESGGKKP